MDKACVFETLNALTQLNRPDEEGNWKAFESSKKIAWKTGTSFGNRDAWSTGITPEYVISVWIGNADGEGRTGLTGINYAAPIMFDLFSVLNTKNGWFDKPNCGFSTLSICTESGYRATENCEQTTNISLPSTCLQAAPCMYHKNISISKLNGLRVDADCELISNIISKKYFVLPPLIEKYYVLKHPEYAKLPAFNKDCITKANDKAMGIIYPKSNSKIIIPNEIDGAKGRAIFEASHKNSSTKIYWHLDNEFVGETTHIHQLEVNPAVGKHLLTLVDENGITLNCKFEVLK
jgi:penicillin-binding protein 1C